MKKLTLTKKSLDELAKTMDVIPESERDNYWGMYDGDCFWRCVAYLSGAGISESAAASYATGYYASQYSGSDAEKIAQATSYLAQNGAGMNLADARNYAQANMVGNNNQQLLWINPDKFNYYGENGYGAIAPNVGHYVILTFSNNGSPMIVDPQNGVSFYTSSSEINQPGAFKSV
ncbi:MAG: hypothetical protein LBQ60_07495 [Bacteroidales bacterium]|jgi:hypothetical protein|nr:hypothetical protein [Bacteroidales bacterium]